MVSKRNVSIALLLVIVFLISSEVADARELAEASTHRLACKHVYNTPYSIIEKVK